MITISPFRLCRRTACGWVMLHGTGLNLDELIFEPGTASGAKARDTEWLVPLLNGPWESGHFGPFLARRWQAYAAAARSNLLQIGRLERQEMGHEGDVSLVTRLDAGLARFAECLDTLRGEAVLEPEKREIRRFAQDMVDERAFQLGELRTRYRGEFEGQVEALDWVNAGRLKGAVRLIGEAMRADSLERIEGLQEARQACRDITIDPQGQGCAGAWFLYGWLTIRTGTSQREAEQAFGRAAELQCAGVLSWLAHRYRACALAELDELLAAFGEALLAVQSRSEPQGMLDAAGLALRLEKAEEARELYQRAVLADPLSLLQALGDEVMANSGHLALDLVQFAWDTARDTTLLEADRWLSCVKAIEGVEREMNVRFSLPEELTKGAEKAHQDAQRADYVWVSLMRYECENKRREAASTALHKAKLQQSRLTSEVEKARAEANLELADRDSGLAVARAQRDFRIHALQSEADRVNQAASGSGTGVGLIAGVSMYCMYLLISGVLNTQGVSIGPKTIFGIVALLVSGGPILISIATASQAAVKRAAVASELREGVEEAEEEYEQAVRAAADRAEAAMERRREALARAENEALRWGPAIEQLSGL